MNDRKVIYLDDAIDALEKVAMLFPYRIPGNRDTYDRYNEAWNDAIGRAEMALEVLPPAQPEIVRCKDCIYYDPEHIENNGIRYEYKDMPKEAFDELETGLVHIGYGINVGGRCCRDYNVGYSEDKRIFVPETNYCGRAERRTDDC